MDKKITLRQRIDWVHKSIERLEASMELPSQEDQVRFLKQESWLLLRRAWELYWAARKAKVER